MDYNEKLAFLRRYRDAQRTMRRLLEELAQLRAEAASVSQALTGAPSGGGDGQAIPRAVERIADAESRLASAYGTALAERSQVEKVIETVPDPLRRDILTRRYRRALRARIHDRSAGRMAPGKSDAQYI